MQPQPWAGPILCLRAIHPHGPSARATGVLELHPSLFAQGPDHISRRGPDGHAREVAQPAVAHCGHGSAFGDPTEFRVGGPRRGHPASTARVRISGAYPPRRPTLCQCQPCSRGARSPGQSPPARATGRPTRQSSRPFSQSSARAGAHRRPRILWGGQWGRSPSFLRSFRLPAPGGQP